MPARNPVEARAALDRFSASPAIANLYAQAHARAIMRRLGTPPDEWPAYRPDLDARLRDAAYYEIWTALDLLDSGEGLEESARHLVSGAEALEFLRAGIDSQTYADETLTATLAYYISGHHARSFVLLREAIGQPVLLPPHAQLIVSVLKKDLDVARDATLRIF